MIGLRLPVGIAANGGAALVDGDENDLKIITIALGASENENAFQQDITLGEDMIFDISDPTMRARILKKLYDIFETFRVKKRFKLKKETITWEENIANQELLLEFKYVNLESDEEKLFRQSFVSID